MPLIADPQTLISIPSTPTNRCAVTEFGLWSLGLILSQTPPQSKETTAPVSIRHDTGAVYMLQDSS